MQIRLYIAGFVISEINLSQIKSPFTSCVAELMLRARDMNCKLLNRSLCELLYLCVLYMYIYVQYIAAYIHI